MREGIIAVLILMAISGVLHLIDSRYPGFTEKLIKIIVVSAVVIVAVIFVVKEVIIPIFS